MLMKDLIYTVFMLMLLLHFLHYFALQHFLMFSLNNLFDNGYFFSLYLFNNEKDTIDKNNYRISRDLLKILH